LARAEDELIRLAIAAGCDWTTVADVYDFGYRTTWLDFLPALKREDSSVGNPVR